MRKAIEIKDAIKDQDGRSVGSAFLMPAKEGTCEICATAHDPDQPHNAQSLFYQTRFNIEHGRAATWIDAMEHCSAPVRDLWRNALIERGVDVDGGGVNPVKDKR